MLRSTLKSDNPNCEDNYHLETKQNKNQTNLTNKKLLKLSGIDISLYQVAQVNKIIHILARAEA